MGLKLVAAPRPSLSVVVPRGEEWGARSRTVVTLSAGGLSLQTSLSSNDKMLESKDDLCM